MTRPITIADPVWSEPGAGPNVEVVVDGPLGSVVVVVTLLGGRGGGGGF